MKPKRGISLINKKKKRFDSSFYSVSFKVNSSTQNHTLNANRIQTRLVNKVTHIF